MDGLLRDVRGVLAVAALVKEHVQAFRVHAQLLHRRCSPLTRGTHTHTHTHMHTHTLTHSHKSSSGGAHRCGMCHRRRS
jgi:hypothetical protein